jgi:hypothetical protein
LHSGNDKLPAASDVIIRASQCPIRRAHSNAELVKSLLRVLFGANVEETG